MIKEDKVLVKINTRNISGFKNLEYDITLDNKDCLVSINHLNKGSKVKVTAICEICMSEKVISYNKYLLNKSRNGKNYYSCFNCKNLEREKTCLKKYGFKSYSMTDEFKETESKKWKGIRKGDDKYRSTMIDRYGVDCYFKTDKIKERNRDWMMSDEFKEKSKKTMLYKWGVDHYSKTEDFKKKINDKKDLIVQKIKSTFLERYGVDWYSKSEEFKRKMYNNKENIINSIKITCLERYGVDNVSKVKEVYDKIINKKVENGHIIPNELITEWLMYKKEVRKLTNRVKKKLYENWDGYDYYDSELILGYLSHTHTHRFYPTIDHKISVYYGFINNIPPSEISDISNLCITKRFINSKKRDLIESEFRI